PRNVGFVPGGPATLFWVEALDQGDWDVKVPHRERLVLKDVGKDARTWLELEQRFDDIAWIEGGEEALLTEPEPARRWTRTFVVKAGAPGGAPRTLWDRSVNDAYGDPGYPVYRRLPSGWAVWRERGAIFLAGEGATADGDRPFLDRLELATLK